MTPARLIPLVAAAVTAGTVPAATGAPVHVSGCAIAAGTVDTFVPIATAGCTLAFHGPLYRGEGFKAHSTPGMIMFNTPYLAQCREFSGSADIVSPTPRVALRHLYGTTWCSDTPSGQSEFITTRGARIKLKGTLIGLDASPQGTKIKVADGLAAVTLPGQKHPIPVKNGQQLNLSATPQNTQRPKPTTLVLSPTEALAVAELKYHVLEISPQESDPFVAGQGQSSALVIGSSDSSSKIESSQFKKVQPSTLTASQVISQPATLKSELERTGITIVLTVGDTSTLETVWALARRTLNHHVQIVFVEH